MVNQNQVNQLFKTFGLTDYVAYLQKENKQKELQELDQTLSKYILAKGVEDLSEEDRKKLISADPQDGTDIYNFFVKHINNFQERLKDYGRDFKRN